MIVMIENIVLNTNTELSFCKCIVSYNILGVELRVFFVSSGYVLSYAYSLIY